jgi:small subunit ribosomal protein S4
MGRNLEPKCKQCRRVGAKLFLKGERCFGSKCGLIRRNYIPGMHGVKLGRGLRLTGYGLQLKEKQKAKKLYRILEKQFKNYFIKAINTEGDTGENLYQLLESRLDNAIFKSGLLASRDLCRQFVNHGHVLVNGKKVTIPSFQVSVKDKITIRNKTMAKDFIKTAIESLKSKEVADWLFVEPKDFSITVVDLPSLKKSQPEYDLKGIIEFYSR